MLLLASVYFVEMNSWIPLMDFGAAVVVVVTVFKVSIQYLPFSFS